MKHQYEKAGLDVEDPSMYSMVCWMTDAAEETGTKGLTFNEFIKQSAFFFSQRHHDEGLRYIFELYDRDQSGHLNFE